MKNWLISKFNRNKDIIYKALGVPVIAAGAMSGACAAGCPYGLVNDPYPGQCPRYIDVNGDGICDLSQTLASQPASTTNSDTGSSAKDPSTSTDIHGCQGANLSGQNDSNNLTVPDHDSGFGSGSFVDGNYHILPLSLIIVLAYLFTHFLFTKGILSRRKHRRIWNILLTMGFIGTGISGVILIFLINLGIKTALNPDITYWHVELAILMVIGTFIHLHIYKKPFKNMFKVVFNFNSKTKKNSELSSNSK